MRKPLSKDLSKYKKPEAMKRMLEDFKNRIAVQMIDDSDYEELERTEFVSGDVPNEDGNDMGEFSVAY